MTSLGRLHRQFERYHSDIDYRKKKHQLARKYYKKNKKKLNLKKREWINKLNQFSNKICLECGKLLDYRTKSKYCVKHWRKNIGEKNIMFMIQSKKHIFFKYCVECENRFVPNGREQKFCIFCKEKRKKKFYRERYAKNH